MKSILLAILLLLIWIPIAQSKSKCRIGYAYTNTVISTDLQEHIYMGFRYGLEQAFNKFETTHICGQYKNIEILKATKDGKAPLDIVRATKELIDQKVILLAGYPTSHESLLGIKYAKENKTALISAGSIANDLGKYKGYFYSTGVKQKIILEHFVSDLKSILKSGKILVLVKKGFVFSIDAFQSLKEISHQSDQTFQFLPIALDDDFQIPLKLLKNIPKIQPTAIYSALYPSQSKKAFIQLHKHIPSSLPIFVSSSWLGLDVSHMNDLPKSLKSRIRAYGIGSLFRDQKERSRFNSQFKNKYDTTPPPIAWYGYITGVYTAKLLSQLQSPTKKEVLKVMSQIECVSSSLIPTHCKDAEGYTNRPSRFFKWKNDRFVVE